MQSATETIYLAPVLRAALATEHAARSLRLGQSPIVPAGERAVKPSGWPAGWWSAAAATQICEAFSADAARRGVNTLVIAFEGFASYDHPGTLRAYEYQAQRGAGDPLAAKPSPNLPLGGLLLHGLIVPLIVRAVSERLGAIIAAGEAPGAEAQG